MYGYKVTKTDLAVYLEPLEGYDHCNHCGEMAEAIEMMDENLEWLTLCSECANTLMRAGG